VLPASYPVSMDGDEAQRPTILLYVRNRALAVAHAVAVPAVSTGQQLGGLVRDALALPGIKTMFDGAVII
jgi:hypothetical protein